jgi:hypothetical protein
VNVATFCPSTFLGLGRKQQGLAPDDILGRVEDAVSHEAYVVSLISLETQQAADGLLQGIEEGEQKVELSASDPQLFVNGNHLPES